MYNDNKGMKMKSIFVLLLLSNFIAAALPPQVQKAKDLDVMTSFVEKHPKVLSTLISINVTMKEVHYGEGCIAKFGRKFSFHFPGWVGPASALEFKDSTCAIDYN